MKEYSFLDIIGPIMVGPSSSHTAGACRIGNAAAKIAGAGFNKIVFNLHGSFAQTYEGHGTDKALIAGCLGFNPDDEEIKHSYDIAIDRGIEIEINEVEIPNAHPNTAQIEFHYPDGNIRIITGISIGGGSIKIEEIDGIEVHMDGKSPTLILKYHEQKGVISKVSTVLAERGYNIGTIKNDRGEDIVTLILELDDELDEETLTEIKELGLFELINYVEGLV
ncbi:MAG: L-serine ammonia-lyase, iron-sulfur-dependent subunit beta [Tissierellia bacterium]|nr:L-serine ammonia-lyase, iron-sulfur-dependent subunit beta [Tissierellia bacterium]